MEFTTSKIVKNVYTPRKKWVKKGDFGRLLVIGGSEKYSGSPALVALAAYAAGCDLVTIVGPKRAMDIAATFSPSLITCPLTGKYLKGSHVTKILELAKDAKSVVIGNGLERNKETLNAISKILLKIDRPAVIDADAIHAVAKSKKVPANSIITPHSHEFFVLTGEMVEPDERQRAPLVAKAASTFNATVLLKGHIDVISNGTKTFFNKTGTPFMTKGGTGDTLAGICGALLGMNVEPIKAAAAAAYINGLAGELASKDFGEGLLAEKLIDFIHVAIKKSV